MEHAFFFPQAIANRNLQPQEKAQQYLTTLLPPANAIFARVLLEQTNAGVNDLEEILKAYIHERMGDNGQKAAYRQLEGLRVCKKPRHMLCSNGKPNMESAMLSLVGLQDQNVA